jgi:CheY-like chemotaxis protein
MLEDSLARAGYAVRTAAEGDSGLALARREVPDLMVLDLLMPGLTGFEVLHELRADRRTAQLPVIVYTAAALSAAERERLNREARALVEKGAPIETTLLEEVARHARPPGPPPA